MARAAGLGETRTVFVVAPIVAGLATAALLAVEAHRGAGYHRRSVEGVLRDYATLAAGEMVRRSAVEIGYYGHSPLIAALQREPAGPGGLRPGVLPTLATRSTALDRAVTLARGNFAWDAETAELRPLDTPF